MLYLHRIVGIFAAVLLLYVAVTGTLVALADMRPLLTDAPATDPDMRTMNVHGNGPRNYAVLALQDYAAEALPSKLDFGAGFRQIAALARSVSPDEAMRLIELRMVAGRPAGHVQLGSQHRVFDLASGAEIPMTELPPLGPVTMVPAIRETFKHIHRFIFIDGTAVVLNIVAGLVFTFMIYTGLVQYFRLLAARHKIKRDNPLWRAGGWWRDLHRWIAVLCAAFIVVLTISGLGLAINSLGLDLDNRFNRPAPGVAGPMTVDASSPLREEELAAMTTATLAAFQAQQPDAEIRVLRLRYFAGYPQGVVITGDEKPRQLVFNTQTGRSMTQSESGYPEIAFPFGWQWHQWLKEIHRGDMIGMPGRWLQLLGGFALVYLSASGIVIYLRMWLRRKRGGRPAFIWR